MNDTTHTKRIFSGIQPTGQIHLGNYLGAIRNWVALQHDYDTIYCIVDMHAITIDQDPKHLHQATLEVAATLLACGLDVEHNIIFHQSANPDHAMMAWIFNCIARMGWLNRMTQFKEKAGKNREQMSTGLFTYPNLMAADILTYHATHVPVGEDQKQHLELTRDIAMRFNNQYGHDFFPLIEPLILPVAGRVMSLRDGTKKMSKSDPSDQSRILMRDNADIIAQKIKKAKSDADLLPDNIAALKARPEAYNLVSMYASIRGITIEQAILDTQNMGFGHFKPLLAECLIEEVAPIATQINEYMADIPSLIAILQDGANKAQHITNPITQQTKDMVGFLTK